MRFGAPSLLALAVLLAAPAAAVPVHTVALTGQGPVPGAAPGATFVELADDYFSLTSQAPSINDQGQVAFQASFSDGTAYGTGVWIREPDGTLTPVAVTGMATPVPDQVPTYGVVSGYTVPLNDAGQVAIHGSAPAQPGMAGTHFLWGPDASADLVPLAESGVEPPGLPPGPTWILSQDPALSAGGHVSWRARLSRFSPGVDPESDSGIWIHRLGGPVELVAREGDAVPGGGGRTYGDLVALATGLSMNASGAFVASVPLDGTGDAVLYSQGPGHLELLALDGQAMPGAPPQAHLDRVGQAAMNEAGKVVFDGTYACFTGCGFVLRDAIWAREPGGDLEIVFQEDFPVPGVPGAVFGNFSTVAMNREGELAFHAWFTGGNGIFGPDADGETVLRLSADDPVPGLLDVSFAEFSFPTLNARGDIAAKAYLRQGAGGVDGSNDTAIVIVPGDGDPFVLVREGDPFEVAPGDVRVVDEFGFFSGVMPALGARSLNDRGEFAFLLTFRDGSQGFFIAQVPEPAGLLLVGGALALAAGSRRALPRRVAHG
jgi:hypothetical protein